MKIRPANPADHTYAITLIHSTAPGFLDFLFGFDDHERALKALTTFYLDPTSRFSFTRGRVCEVEGQVGGLLVFFPGSDSIRLDLLLGRLILKEYSFKERLGFLRNVTKLPSFKETEGGELYVAHLATAPAFRRQGIGFALLEDAVQRAREGGFKRCSLMVDIDNENAIQLYLRAGYKIIDTYNTSRQEKIFKSRGQHRMIREI